MKRYWIRWAQPTEDERPLTFPPNDAILGWWRTGYTCDSERDLPVVPIICALVEAETQGKALEAVKTEWPEAEIQTGEQWAMTETKRDWTPPSDRFPPSEWMLLRLSR